ncbi:hypothetical protein [Massilibacterium senegalense]|uniref:hypothetical protein n=1 Tax=Massilibacterium senegalense TaxID=1632858 RepID=UPI000782A372|nr:hypothetical protein [Massilibacterium senegalense]
MAAKKWPKWAIGLSSIGIFSGALYVIADQTQNQADSTPPTNNATTQSTQPEQVIHLTDTITVASTDTLSTLEQMTEEEKQAREQKLNELFANVETATNGTTETYQTNIESIPTPPTEVQNDRETRWS